MQSRFGKTLVGFSATDLDPSSLEFAHWWSQRTGAPRPTIVHVAPPMPDGEESLVEDVIARRANEGAAEAGKDSYPVEVLHAAHTEAALVEAFRAHHADFLVLRRRAPRWGLPWPALGHFARALIHHAPCSMVVVPTDWAPPQQPGPVIALVTPDEESQHTIDVARKASEALQVDLVLAHAIQDPDSQVGPYYTAPQIEEMREEHVKADNERMKTFLEAISPVPTGRMVSKMGDVRAFAAELTDELGPSLVFISGHRRPLRERLLNPAVQADLAAHLAVPVVLVSDNSA